MNDTSIPQAGDSAVIMAKNNLSIKPSEFLGIPKTVQTSQSNSDRLDENLAVRYVLIKKL